METGIHHARVPCAAVGARVPVHGVALTGSIATTGFGDAVRRRPHTFPSIYERTFAIGANRARCVGERAVAASASAK